MESALIGRVILLPLGDRNELRELSVCWDARFSEKASVGGLGRDRAVKNVSAAVDALVIAAREAEAFVVVVKPDVLTDEGLLIISTPRKTPTSNEVPIHFLPPPDLASLLRVRA